MYRYHPLPWRFDGDSMGVRPATHAGIADSRRRGLGQVVSPREIVFEYRVDDKRCKVTFRRIFEPPPGYSLS